MREGNQSDKIDARRLAELLRLDHLNPVYHGEHGLRTLKELVRSYLTVIRAIHGQVTDLKGCWATANSESPSPINCTSRRTSPPRRLLSNDFDVVDQAANFRIVMIVKKCAGCGTMPS
jgi:hypothetical protein